VGREQEIEIGPMSGLANVTYWLSHRGIDPDPKVVDHVFQAAKRSRTTLEEREILRLVAEAGGKPAEAAKGR
jgi:hypothetical protein